MRATSPFHLPASDLENYKLKEHYTYVIVLSKYLTTWNIVFLKELVVAQLVKMLRPLMEPED